MKTKTISARFMTVSLTAMLVTAAAVPAFAAEDVDHAIAIGAQSGETVSKTVGNVSTANDTSQNAAATNIAAEPGGKAELNVEGNVDATGKIYGAAVHTYGEDAVATENVSGDMNVPLGYNGWGIEMFYAGENTVNIEGDVTVSTGGSAEGATVMMGGENSKGSLTIGGDLTVDAQYYANGVNAQAADGATVDVAVGGDVKVTTAHADQAEGAALLADVQDATVNIQVGGDVTSDTRGLQIYAFDPNASSKVDVLIEGTLTGKETPILLGGDEGKADIKLTAWKITPNADGKIVTYNSELDELADACAELESNIMYIIRVEQPSEGAALSLAGTADSHGFDVAKEGETVTLKAAVKEGYKLTGAFNNGTALTLIDKDGNYYIVVPKGGGVALSVALEKIQQAVAQGSYVPVAAPAPKLIEEYTFTAADSEAKIDFYDNKTVVITLPDGTSANGTFAFVDGKLTFNGIELEVTINEDGSYLCKYVTAAGETYEFTLDAEFVEKLRKASEG